MYMAVAHDVMLRRMKKAAYKSACQSIRETREETSLIEDQTDNEDVIRIWLNHVTSQPIDKNQQESITSD